MLVGAGRGGGGCRWPIQYLNLGHGVLVETPEEAVAHMSNLSKQIKAAELVKA